jgi:hypothetical protein
MLEGYVFKQLCNKIILNMVSNAMEDRVLPFLLKSPQSLLRQIQSLDLLSKGFA